MNGVFGRGADGALWWRHQRASGSWTSWQSLGGRLTSKPVVAATHGARGKLSVFVRGADSAIWYRTLGNGHWGGWTRLGGKLLPGTAPAAVYDYTGHLVAAAVGTDRAIRMFSNISGSRAAERGLGGQTTRDPAITAITSRYATEQVPAAYRAVVFIRGTDGTLRARQVSDPLTAPKGTWRSLGGRLTSGIAAHSDVAGTFTYVFALGAGNQFQMRIGGWPALGPVDARVEAARTERIRNDPHSGSVPGPHVATGAQARADQVAEFPYPARQQPDRNRGIPRRGT